MNHARIVAAHGLLWDYGGVPVASAIFWTSLTLLDPLAVLLLIAKPNVGVLATGAIIVADVVHNLWITARNAGPATSHPSPNRIIVRPQAARCRRRTAYPNAQ